MTQSDRGHLQDVVPIIGSGPDISSSSVRLVVGNDVRVWVCAHESCPLDREGRRGTRAQRSIHRLLSSRARRLLLIRLGIRGTLVEWISLAPAAGAGNRRFALLQGLIVTALHGGVGGAEFTSLRSRRCERNQCYRHRRGGDKVRYRLHVYSPSIQRSSARNLGASHRDGHAQAF